MLEYNYHTSLFCTTIISTNAFFMNVLCIVKKHTAFLNNLSIEFCVVGKCQQYSLFMVLGGMGKDSITQFLSVNL